MSSKTYIPGGCILVLPVVDMDLPVSGVLISSVLKKTPDLYTVYLGIKNNTYIDEDTKYVNIHQMG